MLKWDSARCKLSPGARIKALVINILSCKDPLYQVKSFYREQDVELLFGDGVIADDFNDDALARALDKLYEATPWKVYSTLALQTLQKLDLPLHALHSDTTSFSVLHWQGRIGRFPGLRVMGRLTYHLVNPT